MINKNKKGMHYGVYEQMPTGTINQTSGSLGNRRETSSAHSSKRKELIKRPNFANETSSFSSSSQFKNCIDKKAKKLLIKETEMEFKLRGKFKRVFPSIEYGYYKQFFTEERPLNAILDEKIMSKRRLGTYNQNMLISSTTIGFQT